MTWKIETWPSVRVGNGGYSRTNGGLHVHRTTERVVSVEKLTLGSSDDRPCQVPWRSRYAERN